MVFAPRVLRRLLGRNNVPAVPDDDHHPERAAVLQHAPDGYVLEIGCGFRKTSPSFVGVDLVPGGAKGRVGNVRGKVSQADVATDGGHLPFKARSFDAVVARHNLEHYIDVIGTLREWRRIVHDVGTLVLVVPDEDRYPGLTVALDPTHFHAFNEVAIKNLLSCTGWEPTVVRPCIEGWSLLAVASAV